MRVGKQCGSAFLGWEKARAAGTSPSPEESAQSPSVGMNSSLPRELDNGKCSARLRTF